MIFNSAEEVLQALIHAFYQKRDVEQVLACVTEDVAWVGTQAEELAHGKQEVRRVVAEAVKAVPGVFTVEFDPVAEEHLSDQISLLTISGRYLDIPGVDYVVDVRGTLYCIRTEEGWLIRSIHVSTPNIRNAMYRREYELTEQEIREQQHYRRLIDRLGIAYWEWSRGKGFFASKSFEKYVLSQRPVEQMRNNQVFDEAIHPDDVDKLKEFFAYGDRKEQRASVIIRMKLTDGTYRWTEIFGFKEYDADGENIRLSCVMRDVDKEWIDQKEKLERALEKIRQANASKTEFLARISHDMRTPLNVIIGMTQLAQENENPADTSDCLGKIGVASEFLLGLINDVLDMEHIESGKMVLHLTPYSNWEFRQYIDSVIYPLCRQKNIDFSYVGEGLQEFTVVQDKLRTNQIYFNLLSNAVKCTPEGGKIQFHSKIERVSDSRIGMEVMISDTGIGMSEEFQKYMFEPFSQENQEQKPFTEGTGLGLSIVKKLCDIMDMSISVKSQLGCGTTFTLHGIFEVAEPEPERLVLHGKSCGEKPETEDSTLKNRTVLVCEDHPLNQEIIRRLLERKGIIVVMADNGKRGLEQFTCSAPGCYDAVLMDIRMPVMDGLQAAKAIRSLTREDAKKVPIIALTANAYEEDVEKCRDAGMDEHLAKPVEPKRLYEILQRYLSRED